MFCIFDVWGYFLNYGLKVAINIFWNIAVWQFTELTTGQPALPSLCAFHRRYNFGVLGSFYFRPPATFLFNILLISCMLVLSLLKISCNYRCCLVVIQLLSCSLFTITITTVPPLSAFLIISSRSLGSFILVLSFSIRLLYSFSFTFLKMSF